MPFDGTSLRNQLVAEKTIEDVSMSHLLGSVWRRFHPENLATSICTFSSLLQSLVRPIRIDANCSHAASDTVEVDCFLEQT